MEKSPDDQLVSTIFAVSRLMRQKVTRSKFPDTSSILQIKTLGIVDELKNPSMKEIADYLHILSPSATDIINRLVKAGHLKRTKDATDGRIVRLVLTAQGKQMLRGGLRKISRNLKDFLDVLTEKEKKDFNDVLLKIVERTNS